MTSQLEEAVLEAGDAIKVVVVVVAVAKQEEEAAETDIYWLAYYRMYFQTLKINLT